MTSSMTLTWSAELRRSQCGSNGAVTAKVGICLVVFAFRRAALALMALRTCQIVLLFDQHGVVDIIGKGDAMTGFRSPLPRAAALRAVSSACTPLIRRKRSRSTSLLSRRGSSSPLLEPAITHVQPTGFTSYALCEPVLLCLDTWIYRRRGLPVLPSVRLRSTLQWLVPSSS